ncbi:type II toxin-antitoxin system PemK/MazF family toxin [Plantibacter sp. YIM 135347]|uniref:type II toxin-antitoxin system PemK/MazF family toxin n=1 Tax=Plantibacter sp. YIM 135347 TaxID=3423919 RepID=UPI003D341778
MASLTSILRRVVSALSPTPTRSQPPRSSQRPTDVPAAPHAPRTEPTVFGRPGTAPVSDASPGQFGADATVEVDPKRAGAVSLSYSPQTDGDPDPGEIVWTWVPFEERDGRGKDRPVLVVARTAGDVVLVVQLTSKDHSHQGDFVPLGTGRWDAAGRPSWANLDRVFLVHPSGMRREAATLDVQRFDLVADALRKRYGWR